MPASPYGSEPYGGLSPASSEGLLTYTTKAIASSLDTHIEFLILSAKDIIDRYTGTGIVAKRRFLNRPELPDTPTPHTFESSAHRSHTTQSFLS